jgi:hypothetical protein
MELLLLKAMAEPASPLFAIVDIHCRQCLVKRRTKTEQALPRQLSR